MCIIGGFKWANNLQYSNVNNSINNSHFTKPHTYLHQHLKDYSFGPKKIAQAWDPNKYNINYIFNYITIFLNISDM